MLARAFSILLISVAVMAGGATVAAQGEPSPPDTSPDTSPPSTFNEFWPEERPISDCLGALQRPNCGSEARGGWAQYSIAIALVAGLAFITWRVVRSVRRSTSRSGATRTPDATTVPDDGDGDPAP